MPFDKEKYLKALQMLKPAEGDVPIIKEQLSQAAEQHIPTVVEGLFKLVESDTVYMSAKTLNAIFSETILRSPLRDKILAHCTSSNLNVIKWAAFYGRKELLELLVLNKTQISLDVLKHAIEGRQSDTANYLIRCVDLSSANNRSSILRRAMQRGVIAIVINLLKASPPDQKTLDVARTLKKELDDYSEKQVVGPTLKKFIYNIPNGPTNPGNDDVTFDVLHCIELVLKDELPAEEYNFDPKPLYAAIQAGNLSRVEELLRNTFLDASNRRFPNGDTPLIAVLAAAYSIERKEVKPEVIKLLITNGADPQKKGRLGKSAVDIVISDPSLTSDKKLFEMLSNPQQVIEEAEKQKQSAAVPVSVVKSGQPDKGNLPGVSSASKILPVSDKPKSQEKPVCYIPNRGGKIFLLLLISIFIPVISWPVTFPLLSDAFGSRIRGKDEYLGGLSRGFLHPQYVYLPTEDGQGRSNGNKVPVVSADKPVDMGPSVSGSPLHSRIQDSRTAAATNKAELGKDMDKVPK